MPSYQNDQTKLCTPWPRRYHLAMLCIALAICIGGLFLHWSATSTAALPETREDAHAAPAVTRAYRINADGTAIGPAMRDTRDNWDLREIGIDNEFWSPVDAIKTHGRDVIVAELDSGIDVADHPEFDGNIWHNTFHDTITLSDGTRVQGDAGGYNFLDNNNSTADKTTHGTFVGAIMAKVAHEDLVGLPEGHVKIFPVVTFVRTGRTNPEDVTAMNQGLEYVLKLRQAGANIRVMDWTADSHFGFNATTLSLINELGRAGVLICMPAGNDGQDVDVAYTEQGIGPVLRGQKHLYFAPAYGRTSPMEYGKDLVPDNFVAVAATRPDHLLMESPFRSNWGESTVLTAATGALIASYWLPAVQRYAMSDGTSQATPHVAAAAAMAFLLEPTATPADFTAAMRTSAVRGTPAHVKVMTGTIFNAKNVLAELRLALGSRRQPS